MNGTFTKHVISNKDSVEKYNWHWRSLCVCLFYMVSHLSRFRILISVVYTNVKNWDMFMEVYARLEWAVMDIFIPQYNLQLGPLVH
jgi:hypothetical protein